MAMTRYPEKPLPRSGSESVEAPEFAVTFSRPLDFGGRSDPRPNSFRWAGIGSIRVMESGMLVIAKRRSAFGFYTTEQRFVPASEILDVYRESNSVRVDLRGDSRRRDFFQFWTVDASTAGTIVRLLPTTRTIEYEGLPASSEQRVSLPGQPNARARNLIATVLVIGLIGIGSLAALNQLRHRDTRPAATPAAVIGTVTTPGANTPGTTTPAPGTAAPLHHVTDVEIMNARMTLGRFDDRIDGLRAQFRMAYTSLQRGELSRQDFINGIERRQVPQWRTLYNELTSNLRSDGSLETAVRNRLIDAALGWQAGLLGCVQGLEQQNVVIVLGALDEMSHANEYQREAWRLTERAER